MMKIGQTNNNYEKVQDILPIPTDLRFKAIRCQKV